MTSARHCGKNMLVGRGRDKVGRIEPEKNQTNGKQQSILPITVHNSRSRGGILQVYNFRKAVRPISYVCWAGFRRILSANFLSALRANEASAALEIAQL